QVCKEKGRVFLQTLPFSLCPVTPYVIGDGWFVPVDVTSPVVLPVPVQWRSSHLLAWKQSPMLTRLFLSHRVPAGTVRIRRRHTGLQNVPVNARKHSCWWPQDTTATRSGLWVECS